MPWPSQERDGRERIVECRREGIFGRQPVTKRQRAHPGRAAGSRRPCRGGCGSNPSNSRRREKTAGRAIASLPGASDHSAGQPPMATGSKLMSAATPSADATVSSLTRRAGQPAGRGLAASSARTASRPWLSIRSSQASAKRRNPLSVSISGMTTSCHSSGTSGTCWQSKAMPISRGGGPPVDQPRDGAVVVAGAIADAMAARVEGGERHQHHRRVEHLGLLTRAAVPKPMSTSGAPRTSSRKTIVVLSRMAGRQSLAPLLAQAQTSAAARRPPSASARSRRRSEPGATARRSRAVSAMLERRPRCARSGRARRGGRAPRGAAVVSGLLAIVMRATIVEPGFEAAVRKRRFQRMQRNWSEMRRGEVTIHDNRWRESIPGTYKVGGRRMKKPTGLSRDSSLGINKAPGKMFSCREAQTARPI